MEINRLSANILQYKEYEKNYQFFCFIKKKSIPSINHSLWNLLSIKDLHKKNYCGIILGHALKKPHFILEYTYEDIINISQR